VPSGAGVAGVVGVGAVMGRSYAAPLAAPGVPGARRPVRPRRNPALLAMVEGPSAWFPDPGPRQGLDPCYLEDQ
jgi:hypothetical protein